MKRIDIKSEDYNIYKKNPKDKVYWVESLSSIGEMMVTFDKQTALHLYEDYPHNFTPEQKEMFDRENPFWANHLRGR